MSSAALIGDDMQIFDAAIPSRQRGGSPAQPDPADTADGEWRRMGGTYQPVDWRTRLAGIGGTAVVLLFLAVAVFVRFHAAPSMATAPQPLTVVNLERLEAPAEPVREVPEGPEQVPQEPSRPREREHSVDIPVPQLSLPGYSVPRPTEQASAAEQAPEASAPKSIPAPPATRAANNIAATWQAIILAHLEKYRRYPAAARARGEQGAAQVSFRMNRQGRVLSSRISRSSGSAVLDRAAIDTVKRAQPLPAIPDNMPAELELAVEVEFFTR